MMTYSPKKTAGFALAFVSFILILCLGACKWTFGTDTDTDTDTNITLTAEDFTVNGLYQPAGMAKPVTLSCKTYSRWPLPTIYYNGNTTLPQEAGTYAVTFDLPKITGYNEAKGLIAGTFTLAPPERITITTVNEGNISLYLSSYGSIEVDWGDGSPPDSKSSHTYADSREKTITIKGLLYNVQLNGVKEITAINTQYAPMLIILNCNYTGITSLDVSKNPALTDLSCYDTGITSLDVSKNSALTHLRCDNSRITSLDLSQNPELTTLYCSDTPLTSLTLGETPKLYYIYCSDTGITSLDVSKSPALESLYCYNTGITSLDVTGNAALKTLYCRNTGITSLDVTGNTALEHLYCGNTGISILDVTGNPMLRSLLCYSTGISTLDLSENPALTYISCFNTDITSLDVSKNPSLGTLECHNTKITSLDFTNNPELDNLWCSQCLMDEEALEKMFESLPACSGTKGQLWCGSNPGCALVNHDIARDKNWIVDDHF